MKEEFKQTELAATAEEIRDAVAAKSVTPSMVGGTLLALVNATGEVVDTLGGIPTEHVKVVVQTLIDGITAYAENATVYVDIFNTKGYPAVSLPRKELTTDKNGVVEFDVPHGYQYAVFSKFDGLSASFQWVHTAAIETREVDLWNLPIGIWWLGAIFHSYEEGYERDDCRPTPFVVDHYTNDWDEIEEIGAVDLREGELVMDWYNYGVLVATPETCFVIPPSSKSDERMAWCGNRSYGMYIPCMPHINSDNSGDYSEAQERAREDFDGNMNTAKILGACHDAKAAEWVGSIVYDYSENRWLPSAGQMYLCYLNRTAINKIMQEAIDEDGWDYTIFPYYDSSKKKLIGDYEYWWTSTVYDDFCSWVLSYGNVYRNYRGYDNSVRAVSAFHFEY